MKSTKRSASAAQYALEEKIYFEIGPNLYHTDYGIFPSSFDFSKDEQGTLRFAFEILILERGSPVVKSTFKYAGRWRWNCGIFSRKEYTVRPLFDKEFSDGEYELYSEKFYFDRNPYALWPLSINMTASG